MIQPQKSEVQSWRNALDVYEKMNLLKFYAHPGNNLNIIDKTLPEEKKFFQ
jgi:hypothetical protein